MFNQYWRNFASLCKIDNLTIKCLETDTFFNIITPQWRSVKDERTSIIEDHS